MPRFAKAGLPGQSRDVILELKLLADVGLVGFPNVGKSTLLSVVSRAQPKIANYHFTTLFPNLGVVYVEEGVSFVMADIPGIIEGAAEGAGLGHDFLRHIDRCRLLIHVVDVSGSEGRDPVADFEAINEELKQYSPELARRRMIVAANKVDIMTDPALLDALRAHVEGLGLELVEISAAAHQGTRELVLRTAQLLQELPPWRCMSPPMWSAPRGGHRRGGGYSGVRRHLGGGRPLAPAAHRQRQLWRLRVPELVRPEAAPVRAVRQAGGDGD